ncbi:hypothetical protein FK513_29300, partial [Klebsiella pneumoniae]|nr:hypothetical protein [Klebsiella pneumoniae]
RTHNLRDVSFTFPRDAMVVFTGISGSGKSSLAFDTLYAGYSSRSVGPPRCAAKTRPGNE